MKNALYVLWYDKRHLLGAEAMSNRQKIKPVALAVIESCLSEGISKLLCQSVENCIE